MFKNKSKLLILFMIAILLLSTFSFATDEVINPNARAPEVEAPISTEEGSPIPSPSATPTPNPDETSTEGEGTNTPDTTGEIFNGSLTVFEDDYTMDRLIDGNVLIFANNVTVSGQVNGNIIIFANTVTFTDSAYIANSIYVFANKVDYSGICVDLNIAANIVNISYSSETSFAFRDMNICANSFTFAGGVGRNANVLASKFNFVTEDNASGIIYGNLNYSSTNELSLGENHVEGNVTYKHISESNSNVSIQKMIMHKLFSLGSTLVYTAIIFLLTMLIAPRFANHSANKFSKLLPAIGIGALTMIAIPLIFIILMFTGIGVSFGFVLLAMYFLLFFVYSSITNIYLANALRNKFKVDKFSKFLLVLLLTTVVIWALQQIPYIGWIVSVLVALIGAGLLIMGIFSNAKKNVSEATSINHAE